MRRSRAIVSAILAFALLLSWAVPTFAVPAGSAGSHRDKADAARQAAQQAEAEAARLAAEAEKLDAQVAALDAQLDALRPKIETAEERTARLTEDVARLRSRIRVKRSLITSTQAALQEQESLLAERVSGAYKRGEYFYFDLLLGASDLNDLIARTALVQRVIVSNQRLASELEDTRFELAKEKAELDRDLETTSVKRSEARAEQRRLEGLHAERRTSLEGKQQAESTKRELVAENKATAAKLRALALAEDRAAAAIEAELRRRASQGGGHYNGSMTWPTPASGRVTSPFGSRFHPVLGYRRMHSGIDIGAPYGSTIVAAGSGTVIFSGVRGGYGSTIMIDHGDGVVTLYGHQSRLSVSEGERVSAGQKIGEVGSSGLSTGPHLHFEVRVNGSARDPRGFV